jgi:hypothetical protein
MEWSSVQDVQLLGEDEAGRLRGLAELAAMLDGWTGDPCLALRCSRGVAWLRVTKNGLACLAIDPGGVVEDGTQAAFETLATSPGPHGPMVPETWLTKWREGLFRDPAGRKLDRAGKLDPSHMFEPDGLACHLSPGRCRLVQVLSLDASGFPEMVRQHPAAASVPAAALGPGTWFAVQRRKTGAWRCFEAGRVEWRGYSGFVVTVWRADEPDAAEDARRKGIAALRKWQADNPEAVAAARAKGMQAIRERRKPRKP